MPQLMVSSARRLEIGAVLVALASAGCGDAVEIARGPRFTLDPLPSEFVVGQQVTIALRWAGATPSDARVAWRVAPDSIVRLVSTSLTSATLEALRVGAATVTVTATSDDRVSSQLLPLRIAARVCPLNALVVSPTTASVAVGGQVRIVGRVLGHPREAADSIVTYRVQDTTIAVVDGSGVVTGRRPGTTAVVAATLGCPGVTAAAAVNVLGGGSLPVSPVVEPNVVDVVVGDTVRLRAGYSFPPNSNGSREIRFVSADSTIASVDASGLLRALRVGQTHVRAVVVADTAVWLAVPVTVRAR